MLIQILEYFIFKIKWIAFQIRKTYLLLEYILHQKPLAFINTHAINNCFFILGLPPFIRTPSPPPN